MKCWHLVAAIAFAGCGLNTTALPSTGQGAEDAGTSSAGASWDMSLAGSPATWPARRRPSQILTDGGSGDTNDAAKPPRGSTANDRDAQTDEAPSAPARPGDSAKPPAGQPASGGAAKPGSQVQPQGSASDNGNGNGGNDNGGNDNGSNGNGNGSNGNNGSNGSGIDTGQNGASSNGSAGPTAPGSAGSGEPDKDQGEGDADSDRSSDEDEEDRGGSGQSSGSNGQPGRQPQSNDAVSAVVDLVLAILDLSLGPVRPAEIETLVSSILVLSLAPADLAAESLVAVLDALADTQICFDHPERCNPLCTNLESDCSACGRDQDCIERIEEMCRVTLPKTCR